ncbi:MAG: N-acyl homoserine lactonase family protein [Bryobacterales bacterium]|nr:N-acyl homoserine lactonase family protein [Bryobacterales bacterium]
MLRCMKKALLCVTVLLAAVVPDAMAQPAKARPPKTPRLYIFDCGTLYATDTSAYQLKKEEVATTTMSMACFLIAHPKGNLIWDAGAIPDGSFKSGEGTMRNSKSTKTLTAQMTEIGYSPADIKYLALSHFHWDHVGNANLFAGATWLTPKAERDVMFGDPPSPRTEPASFSALRNSKTVFISKDEYDVFGDKTVIIKAAPGHSPGHQVLYLKLAKTGPVVLSGDLYHYPEERTLSRVPTTEFNAGQTVISRAAVEALVKKTGAQLWIQHDFTGSGKLKKAPQFYE